MSTEADGADLVRASRDGDQFHYAWAARQSLKLLSTQTGLTAVTIEGASVIDKAGPDGLAGDELIDVGLYFGSEAPADAEAIRYVQLKHSTRRTQQSWTPGELEKTLAGFAARYKTRLKHLPAAFSAGRVRFQFISNRRFSKPILTSLRQLAEGSTPIRGIHQHGCAVGQFETAAHDQANARKLGRFVGAHDTSQTVAVGDR